MKNQFQLTMRGRLLTLIIGAAILGIIIDPVMRQLEDEGVEKFNRPLDKLMATPAQIPPWHLAGEL
jgi:hypothetical protein